MSHIDDPYPIETPMDLIDVRSPLSISNIDIGSYLVTLVLTSTLSGSASSPQCTFTPHFTVSVSSSSVKRRKLNLRAKFDVGTSYYSFKR
jgi:hypothetical protein